MSNLSIPLYEGDGYLRLPKKLIAPASSGGTPPSAEVIDRRTVEKQARTLRAVVIGNAIERVFNWLDQKYQRARWRDVDAFLQTALARLRGSRSVVCLAPSHGDSLCRQLRGLAFRPVEDYTAMAKRLAKHAEELSAETRGAAVTAT